MAAIVRNQPLVSNRGGKILHKCNLTMENFKEMVGSMSVAIDQIQRFAINTIRTLAMDAVQKANSGHPGTPMAITPLAYLLYTETMLHNLRQLQWPDRDRLVLSACHSSMVLYSLL